MHKTGKASFIKIIIFCAVGIVLSACSAASTTDTSTTTDDDTSTSPFLSATLYVDPDSSAARQAEEWQASRPEDAELLSRIATQPTAKWFGDWNDNISEDVDAAATTITAAGALPVFVAYNIPNRDCGGYSAGGAEDAAIYQDWIEDFADAIGDRSAVIILEPDAMAYVSCLSDEDRDIRFSLLSQAVSTFKAKLAIAVYIDAGNPSWFDANEIADRLVLAGIAEADGFALNVSNFYTTDENITYGEDISTLVDGKHFVIDISRNGLGSDGEWCNPSGRALGDNPSVATGHDLVDALLWIKPPGESDGECNDGPAAGEWWPEYALELARLAAEN